MRCGLCGGPLQLLGQLGTVQHFCCRNCGMGWSKKRKRGKRMSQGRVLLLLLLSAVAACAPNPARPSLTAEGPDVGGTARLYNLPVCEHEALDCFSAAALLTAGTSQLDVLAVWEDGPHHYLLSQSARPALEHLVNLGPFVTTVCATAIRFSNDPTDGGLHAEARGYWDLRLRPIDAGLREELWEMAPSGQCSWQVFSVVLTSSGEYEILIFDPYAAK